MHEPGLTKLARPNILRQSQGLREMVEGLDRLEGLESGETLEGQGERGGHRGEAEWGTECMCVGVEADTVCGLVSLDGIGREFWTWGCWSQCRMRGFSSGAGFVKMHHHLRTSRFGTGASSVRFDRLFSSWHAGSGYKLSFRGRQNSPGSRRWRARIDWSIAMNGHRGCGEAAGHQNL